jgi:protein-S-isoprenylcysteine O-methyltransferase Ste14
LSPSIPPIILLAWTLIDLRLVSRWRCVRQEPVQELLARILGANFFSAYLAYRIDLQTRYHFTYPFLYNFFSWLNWSLTMATIFLFFMTYFTRVPAVAPASRLREIVFPFLCVLLPFGVYESTGWTYFSWLGNHPSLVAALKPFFNRPPGYWNWTSTGLIFFGNLLIVTGMFSLKSSFSIMAEARIFISRGPYRWIRHPIYVGESLATLGFCVLNPSWFNLFLTALFILMQRVRAHFEEIKLEKVFPEYLVYKERTGAYFPRIVRPES